MIRKMEIKLIKFFKIINHFFINYNRYNDSSINFIIDKNFLIFKLIILYFNNKYININFIEIFVV